MRWYEKLVTGLSIVVVAAGIVYGTTVTTKTILQLTEMTAVVGSDYVHVWDTNAAAARRSTIANLGRGISVDTNELTNTLGSLGLADHNTARAALGLAIGTDVQAYSATLLDIADGTIAANLVNTANPWAANEVADDINLTSISQIADITASAAEINTPLDGATTTLAEFQQLQTIGATTISANQWAVLGGIAETLTAAEVDILDGVTGVTPAELSYIGDVTSLIQAQIDGKEGTLTNEAGLYAALSDVSQFLEPADKDTWAEQPSLTENYILQGNASNEPAATNTLAVDTVNLASGAKYQVASAQIDHDDMAGLGDVTTTGHSDAGMRLVETTTDVDVTVTGSRAVFINNHNSTINYTLPADPETAGGDSKVFWFRNRQAAAITITPASGDVIELEGTDAAASEAIVSTGAVGEFICLQGFDDAGTDRWVSWFQNSAAAWDEASP